jgi:hypothetical protein
MTTTSSTDAIYQVLDGLRHKDRVELAECGRMRSEVYQVLNQPCVLGRAFISTFSKQAAAIVAFRAMTPKALTVALLATDEWEDVAREVYRWGVKEAKPYLLRSGYVRVECRTMEGHDEAIRFLEHFGFVLETRIARYGLSGKAFLQYAWRFDDHAHEAAAALKQSLPKCNGCGAGQDWQI